jgi:hypothetical protein
MIYLIITSSIESKYGIRDDEHRKRTYLECIQQALLVSNGTVKPIIVENNGARSTYLDGIGCDVVYTNNNVIDYGNKGVNELQDIKEVISIYNISDDDIVIKLTGRYFMMDTAFIQTVLSHPNTDAFIKFFNVCTCEYVYDDCVLGLYAIRCKYLKQFEYECIKSPEVEFATYIRRVIPDTNIMPIDVLNLRCCFAGDLRIQYV